MIIRNSKEIKDIYRRSNPLSELKQIQRILRKTPTGEFKEVYNNGPTGYEYPTFSINDNGELVATYQTDNRNLTFSINDNGELVAHYNGENPGLYINDEGYLVRTIPDTP